MHGLFAVSGAFVTRCVSVVLQYTAFLATLYLYEVIILSHISVLPLPVGCMSY